jgi:hypothetical protein
MRESSPERYCELAGKLIMTAEPPSEPSDFSTANSMQDIPIKMAMSTWGAHELACTLFRGVGPRDSCCAPGRDMTCRGSLRDGGDEEERIGPCQYDYETTPGLDKLEG